jgi:prepilin-type N-terminal cleavage/methylation domain-containing protein
MTTAPKDRPRTRGFTLTELLVVIGVISILIGVIFPVIKKVRMSAYAADTENEISQISNACTAYYSTYRAYPGPFSNFQTEWGSGNGSQMFGTTVEGTGSTTATLAYTFNGTTYSPIVNPYYVTGAENLVLGLMGGLRVNATVTAPYNIAFAPSEVGQGPMSLNVLNPARNETFFPAGSNYLLWCEQTSGGATTYQTTTYNANDTLISFTDQAGVSASDSPIPEFVDRFPTPGPLPILYLRARVGAKGVVSDGTISDAGMAAQGTGVTAQYQYDMRDILNYTNAVNCPSPSAKAGPIGLPKGFSHDLIALYAPTGNINTTPPAYPPPGVVKAGAMLPLVAGNPTPNGNAYQDGFPYFCNPTISPISNGTVLDANYNCRPRAVDQFILISAGPDGIYGTGDDITSFGSFSQ